MKKLTLLSFCLLFAVLASAQNKASMEDYALNFNGFQRARDKYPDSAIRYLQTLATIRPEAAEELLHESFAQSFIPRDEEKYRTDPAFLASLKRMNMTVDSALKITRESVKNAYIILEKLENDTSQFIKEMVFPISCWIQSQKNFSNPENLKEIGKAYISYLKGTNNFYSQRKARYALMIARLMYNNDKLRPDADQVIKLIYNNLQDHQVNEDLTTIQRSIKEKRAWYRYMFAYCNFIMSQDAKLTQDQKLGYLKLAYEHSPDILDKTVSHAYFYDMIFLFGNEKYSFEEDYLSALGSDEEKFKTVMAMSMNNPSFKQKAKALYKGKVNFGDYWLNEFNKKFQQAPLFSLTQIDSNQYVLGKNKEQWTLIDFWGTWCSPCRQEHPDLQKLYLNTMQGEMKNLNIITIASNDREPTVKEYMKNLNYTFPVVMSDNQIERKYNVSSWPSKFLVSPQGKYVVIPFNVDWQKYISDYIN